MKKTLLTTTALIAAFAAADASANNLQVNIGGYADFQAGYVSDDIVGEPAAATGLDNNNEVDLNTDTEIHVSVEGASDNGLEYGAVVELEANVGATGDGYDDGNNADKAFVFLQGGWGRVEAGENTGAEEALSVNTGNFASATGGVEGDFYRYIGRPSGDTAAVTDNGAAEVRETAFNGIIRPQLITAHSGTGSLSDEAANEDATKITYYSPRFSGFQVGLSYTANSGDTSRNGAAGANDGESEDIFSGGINYSNQFDEVGVNASLTAISGDAKTTRAAAASATTGTNPAAAGFSDLNNDIEGYAAGLNLSYAGFTAGGSYGDYQDSLGAFDSNYYDLGLGYTAGAFSVSATYLNSEVNRPTLTLNEGADNAAAGGDDDTLLRADNFENIVIGADYQLAPGLVPYAEVAFFEIDGSGTTAAEHDNEGTVLMLGTELSF